MKNNRKNVQGFTLVELIVVIAIIGVLSAIMIPSILGYVKRAKYATANANAKSLFSAGMLACRESDITRPIPEGIYSKVSNSGLDGSAIENPEMTRYINERFTLSGKVVWAIIVRDEIVTGACTATDNNSPYVGTYPHPNNTALSIANGNYAAALNFAEYGS